MANQSELSMWMNDKVVARPEIRIGATVRVHQKIKEGDKERIQIFEGLVIKKSGCRPDLVITVRKVTEGIGVEKIIPVMSANIEKIDIVKHAKVRRAKLYYMRERSGKSARLKEVYLTDEERKALMDAQVVIVEATPEVKAEAAEKNIEVVKAEEEVVAEAPATEAAAEVEAPKAE